MPRITTGMKKLNATCDADVATLQRLFSLNEVVFAQSQLAIDTAGSTEDPFLH